MSLLVPTVLVEVYSPLSLEWKNLLMAKFSPAPLSEIINLFNFLLIGGVNRLFNSKISFLNQYLTLIFLT